MCGVAEERGHDNRKRYAVVNVVKRRENVSYLMAGRGCCKSRLQIAVPSQRGSPLKRRSCLNVVGVFENLPDKIHYRHEKSLVASVLNRGVLVAVQIRFKNVGHCVNRARSHREFGKRRRYAGVHYADLRIKNGRPDICFFVRSVICCNRYIVRFGRSCGFCRYHNRGKRVRRGNCNRLVVTGNKHLPRVAVVFNARTYRFCGVHNATAAERNDNFYAFFSAYIYRFFDVGKTRIRFYLEKFCDGNACIFETFIEFCKQFVEKVVYVVGDEHCLCAVLFGIFSDILGFTGTEDDTDRVVKFKVKHKTALFRCFIDVNILSFIVCFVKRYSLFFLTNGLLYCIM